MTSSPAVLDTSRRRLLKALSGAPLLPLAGYAGASSLLSACGGGDDASLGAPIATITSVSFAGMDAPATAVPIAGSLQAAAMSTVTAGSRLVATYNDGSTQAFALRYEPFFMTGDMLPDGQGGMLLAGGYVDIHGQPIVDGSVPGQERQFFSDSPDGSSLLSLSDAAIPGIKGKAVFAVVQFEYNTRDQAGNDTYGTLPSPIAVLTLDQDSATGKLSLVKYHNIDTSPAHGLWITCGASLSPWNTHLSSEEYEPDAAAIATNVQFKRFSQRTFGDETANPYHYGHLPEVTVHPDGTGTIKKHYCLGRISHELIQVMPDQRTAIMGDDYTNGGFFMFIADKAADLSAGTLYVAKVGAGFSIDPAAAGAPLTWIRLGHATSDEIEALADTLKAGHILDVSLTDPADATYTKIFCDGKANWVRVKAGMEKAAAFLETHRYANLVGASMAFTKMEGTTVNAKDKVAYSALQNMQGSMVRNNVAWRESLGVTLDKALVAGGVMAHSLAGAQKDTAGDPIDSEWVPVQTRALLLGEDLAAADALGNLSNPDKIGNPDNLKFSEKLRTLFIGEDSSTHVNNFLWAYNVDTKVLSRLLSVPAGAESTGLHAVDQINGWTYIMSNFQHPGDWGSLHKNVQVTLDPLVRANYKDRCAAAVGYLTGLPLMD